MKWQMPPFLKQEITHKLLWWPAPCRWRFQEWRLKSLKAIEGPRHTQRFRASETMSFGLKLNVSNPRIKRNSNFGGFGGSSSIKPHRLPYHLRLPARPFNSAAVQFNGASEPSISSHYTESVGTPSPSSPLLQLSRWNLTHRHIVLLNVVACAVILSL